VKDKPVKEASSVEADVKPSPFVEMDTGKSLVQAERNGEVYPKPERDKDGKWKKGFSGNPATQFEEGNTVGKNGRRNAVSDLLRVMGDEKKGDGTRMEAVLNRLYQLAEAGDIRAIQELLSRVWGRSPETILTKELAPDELIIS